MCSICLPKEDGVRYTQGSPDYDILVFEKEDPQRDTFRISRLWLKNEQAGQNYVLLTPVLRGLDSFE